MASKLPLKLRIFAKLAGLDMKFLAGIWSWLDGKKTIAGLIVSAIGGLAVFTPQIAAVFPNAKWAVVAVGVTQFLNGWAHKAYKYKYNEDYVKSPKE